MQGIGTYSFIIAASLMVICSYLFNILSKKTGIPSVLLLLLAGIGVREVLAQVRTEPLVIPHSLVEIFGILGLIMIILEAGLDLKVSKGKIKLIRNAFFSALFIFLLSAGACSALLYHFLGVDYLRCLIYSIPLSIVSSAIVIPSVSHFEETKKEFLVYETSFSDIIGIMLFNYMISGNLLQAGNIVLFFGTNFFAIIISIVFSILILFLLTRITTKVKFFLVFSILILLYAGGKQLHLPSLFIILLFGLTVANWQTQPIQALYKWATPKQVADIGDFLHHITAESSFIIRTFFFFLFGLTIDVRLLTDYDVILIGSLLVLVLLAIRFIYLRFFLHSHIFPELFFMPRGLITILLFYSIPAAYTLSRFNQGILFFVILSTSVIMMIGSISYGRPKLETINDEVPVTDNGADDE
jgi:Kef-type K+ transport system membrane component KefB